MAGESERDYLQCLFQPKLFYDYKISFLHLARSYHFHLITFIWDAKEKKTTIFVSYGCPKLHLKALQNEGTSKWEKLIESW